MLDSDEGDSEHLELVSEIAIFTTEFPPDLSTIHSSSVKRKNFNAASVNGNVNVVNRGSEPQRIPFSRNGIS